MRTTLYDRRGDAPKAVAKPVRTLSHGRAKPTVIFQIRVCSSIETSSRPTSLNCSSPNRSKMYAFASFTASLTSSLESPFDLISLHYHVWRLLSRDWMPTPVRQEAVGGDFRADI